MFNVVVSLFEMMEGLGFQILEGGERKCAPFVPRESNQAAQALRASRLRVQLIEGSVVKVDLEFPGRSALALEELLPESVLTQLQGQGVSIAAIQESLVKDLTTNGAPRGSQELFHQVVGHRMIRVWLMQSLESRDS